MSDDNFQGINMDDPILELTESEKTALYRFYEDVIIKELSQRRDEFEGDTPSFEDVVRQYLKAKQSGDLMKDGSGFEWPIRGPK